MPNIGVPELLIVLVIALVVLGPKKLPEVGRSLGKGMREFKDSIAGVTGADDDDDDDDRPALSKGDGPSVSASSTKSSAAGSESQTTS